MIRISLATLVSAVHVWTAGCSGSEPTAEERVAREELATLERIADEQRRRSEQTLREAEVMRRENEAAQARAELSDAAHLLIHAGLRAPLAARDRAQHCDSLLALWNRLAGDPPELDVSWSPDELRGWCMTGSRDTAACLHHAANEVTDALIPHLEAVVIGCRLEWSDGALDRPQLCREDPDTLPCPEYVRLTSE